MSFLAEGGLGDSKFEFLMPTEVAALLSDGVKVKVLPTPSKRFGITFSEKMPMVREVLEKMTRAGVYPLSLF